jgi:hypothetical protein
MDLSGTSTRSPATSRAPKSGLKLMLAILVLFALLAIYGQWQHFRRPRTETATITPTREVSPSPSPNDN